MTSRKDTQYKNFSEKFLIKSFDYQRQFSHLYAHRLTEMMGLLKQRIQKKWGDLYPVYKVSELREEQQETCIIIGTIYKHQTHKPSILREISEENQLAPQPPRLHYADPDDKLILEDELQRVRLYGKVDTRYMATGVVCAAMGSVEEDGRFDVEEMLYYESGPQQPLPKLGKSRRIVLISGLDQMQSSDFVDALNLFQHWLCGNIDMGGNEQLVRIIVAGNSVRTQVEQREASCQIARNQSEPNQVVAAMQSLDKWFAAWSESIPLDLLPGVYDPANFMLPQQPFHSCMFPLATKNNSFRSVTNPYACQVDNAFVVGTAGQNVDDLLRCTMLEKPMNALCSTLIWGHIAPTAPDTLSCFPYVNSDPFIIRECPHIYFVGNCDNFTTKLHKGSDNQITRLVCVPTFSKTHSAAVVDLETLDCQEICFNVAID